jgi:hypothetical protein
MIHHRQLSADRERKDMIANCVCSKY